MSLYTPVFPSSLQASSSLGTFPSNDPHGKKQTYAEFLRDIHLFLSSQNDILSPPSRPSSPMIEHRVQKIKDEIQDVFSAMKSDPSSGQWTRISQTLKLGCVRGRRWTPMCLPNSPVLPGEDTNWILPDEESEWIEWEKKREESRRLKAKTNASQQIGSVIPSAMPGSQQSNRASFVESSEPRDVARERRPPDVSPATLRDAKDKVRKWQASMASEPRRDATSASSSSQLTTVAADAIRGQTGVPERTRTIDFTVVKPAAKSIMAKKGKGSLSQPTIGGTSSPMPSRRPKSPNPTKVLSVAESTAPLDIGKTASKGSPKFTPAKDGRPKIRDVPETPYLPPSFPSHLNTSTPLADSVMVVRAKPSPILPIPATSSTPLPSTPADPPDDRELNPSGPHADNVSTSHPPQINTVQPGKRSEAPSTSLDSVADGNPPVPPPAKKIRTLSQNRTSPVSDHAKPMSKDDLEMQPSTRNDPNPYETPPEMAMGAPSTPGRNDKPVTAENSSSPTKSVKSFFSAPDSDTGESPMRGNLLLESPVSPMLMYAQNPSTFLPQITSTQMRKGSPAVGRTESGTFGMGYSSQFDIERHVDRVSEMLDKEVDFDGWMRDLRTVEESQD